jgi:hypothetical protein
VDDLMFNSGELRLALEAQANKMQEAVEGEPEGSLKQAETEEWATALAHHFAVTCPQLQTDDVWREPVKDVKIDVSHDQMRHFSDPTPTWRATSPATVSSSTCPSRAKRTCSS